MKQAIKSIRELGRKTADMDGKRKGVSQREGEFIFQQMVNIRAAEIILKRRTSVIYTVEEKAWKKARKYLKDLEMAANAKRKAGK